ncbi:hypothetical protein GA830_01205 [Mesorhizobium sp. NBSH29]|uniref:hypothetical protein n=1 Tax=Mesorhizobium sp. NBSH29 TaxID=2654249 RepID=UPI00189646FA|nr:hypothetical protein [Mesorhizobium sp. NBSH29]QPC85515.1 hypothetical protein GA830_01205 [Mesorhizobium sp. NBSH29]
MHEPLVDLLPAPSILQAMAGIIGSEMTRATVIVPVYPGKSGDDRITVTWARVRKPGPTL